MLTRGGRVILVGWVKMGLCGEVEVFGFRAMRPGVADEANWGQAESTVHMLNWAIRSVKFLGVEFDQSEDEEVSVSDTTHL